MAPPEAVHCAILCEKAIAASFVSARKTCRYIINLLSREEGVDCHDSITSGVGRVQRLSPPLDSRAFQPDNCADSTRDMLLTAAVRALRS